MTEEQVDIVDEQENVLGQTAKNEAHHTGALHRCVIGEIRDIHGNYVLVKQASDRQDAGQFVAPIGGHVTAGETNEEALKREAFEEAGIVDFTYEYVGRGVFNRHVLNRHENHLFIVYLITIDTSQITLGPEAVEWRAFSEEELQSELAANPKLFGDAHHALLRQFYPHLSPK